MHSRPLRIRGLTLLVLVLHLVFQPLICAGTTDPAALRTRASTSTDPYELAEIAYAFTEDHNLPEDAIITLRKAVQYKRTMDRTAQVQLTYNLAYALQRNGNIPEAITIYEDVGRQGITDGWVKAAQCAQEMGNIPQSIVYLQSSLTSTKEPNPQTFIYLGDMLNNLKRFSEAENTYRDGLAILRKYTQGRLDGQSKGIALALYHGLGDTLLNMKRYTEALEQYTTALRIDPTNTKLLTSAWMCSADLVWWKDWEDKTDQLIRIANTTIVAALSDGSPKKRKTPPPAEEDASPTEPSPLSPYEALFMDLSHELRSKLSRNWSSRLMQRSRRAIWGPSYATVLKEKTQLLHQQMLAHSRNTSVMRIGYISRRFEDYPGTHLMLGMFKRHNRHRTRIYCYASGPDDHSNARSLVRSGCDEFTDISALSPESMMERITQDNLHTLIDYDGLHDFNNVGLLSLRPVVNQITFLGFAATSGNSVPESKDTNPHPYETNSIDYNIVDRVTAPAEYVSAMFTEPVLYVSGTYQPQDPEQKIDKPLPLLPNLLQDNDESVFRSKGETWKQFRQSIRKQFKLPSEIPLLSDDIMYRDETVIPFTGVCNDIRIVSRAEENIPVSITDDNVPLSTTPYATLTAEPVIYTCFNRWHKIDPVMFTSWINILIRQSSSILWLYGGRNNNDNNDLVHTLPYTEYTNITLSNRNISENQQYCHNSSSSISSVTTKNKLGSLISSSSIGKLSTDDKENLHIRHLRFEASARGIHPSRIIFANKAPRSTHLYRHYAADILLDTRIYGAHTTAADGLFTGLPVVTLFGKGFASRVGASLVTSVSYGYEGIDDSVASYRFPASLVTSTITSSHTEYENTAVFIGAKTDRFTYLRYLQHAAIQASIERNTRKDNVTMTGTNNNNERIPSLFDAQQYTANFENGVRASFEVKMRKDTVYRRIMTN